MLIDIPQQELIYIALAFRVTAQKEREYADKATSMSVKDAHRNAAVTYDRLAEKYERLSQER